MDPRKCFAAAIALLFLSFLAQPALAQQGAPPLREQPVKTPNVTGMPLEKAREVAKKAGFDLTVSTRETAQKDADNVILEQQPITLKGARAFQVHVGKYKAPPIPNLSHMPLGQAKEALQKAGYEAKVVEAPVTDEKQFGVVQGQSQHAQIGTNIVTVFVGAPDKVFVPGVMSMTAEQAMKTLEKAGLKGTQTSVPTTLQTRDGKVLKQDPLPGVRVVKNSSVTLTVQTYQAPQKIVPSVLDLSESDAKQKLAPLHHSVTVATKATAFKEKDGKVIEQVPAPNTEIQDKATVRITVGHYSPTAVDIQITPNPADKSYRLDVRGGMQPFHIGWASDDPGTSHKKDVEITALPQTPGVSSFRIVTHADAKVLLNIIDSKGAVRSKHVDLRKDAR